MNFRESRGSRRSNCEFWCFTFKFVSFWVKFNFLNLIFWKNFHSLHRDATMNNEIKSNKSYARDFQALQKKQILLEMSGRNCKIFLNCSFLGSSWVFEFWSSSKKMIHFLFIEWLYKKNNWVAFSKMFEKIFKQCATFLSWQVNNMKIYVTGCLIFLDIFRNKKKIIWARSHLSSFMQWAHTSSTWKR